MTTTQRLLAVPGLAVLSFVACVDDGTGAMEPVEDAQTALEVEARTSIVENSKAGAVVSAVCPAGTVITGGGCGCALGDYGAVLFGGSPAGNAYVCGCTDSRGTTEAYANCLGTPLRGTLTGPDPAAVAMEERFRRQLRIPR